MIYITQDGFVFHFSASLRTETPCIQLAARERVGYTQQDVDHIRTCLVQVLRHAGAEFILMDGQGDILEAGS